MPTLQLGDGAGEQLSVTFLCCILLATLALRRLTASVLRLCETMSPSAPRVKLGAFQWHKVGSQRGGEERPWYAGMGLGNWESYLCFCLEGWIRTRIVLGRQVWLGLFLGSCLYPVGAIVSSVRSDIEWSGVRYFVKHGKIERVSQKLIGVGRGREKVLQREYSKKDVYSYVFSLFPFFL